MNIKLREQDGKVNIEKLQRAIAYKFKDPQLLIKALTHKSYSGDHYERIEFLGDSVLNTVIAIYLFENFPDLDEGVLSRTRASLVKGETLASIARALEIGDCLLLGTGELKSGGHQRPSILADALEALIGAVHLESGFERAQKFVLNLYHERLEREAIESLGKDPKSRLQEYLQAHKMDLPLYKVVKTEGKDHDQMFTVACYVEALGIEITVQARNRRNAERKAAEKVLQEIEAL